MQSSVLETYNRSKICFDKGKGSYLFAKNGLLFVFGGIVFRMFGISFAYVF